MGKKKINKDFVIARVQAWNHKIAKLLKTRPLRLEVRFRNGMNGAHAVAVHNNHTKYVSFSLQDLNKERSALYDWLIAHEIAHFYAERLHNDYQKPHGDEWVYLMLRLGLPPILEYNKQILRKYIESINHDWHTFSLKRLSDPNTTIARFNKKKLKRDYGAAKLSV